MTEPLDLEGLESRWASMVKIGDEPTVRLMGHFVEPLIEEVRRLRAESAKLRRWVSKERAARP